MGNKRQGGLEEALNQAVITDNDVICIGLQESTYNKNPLKKQESTYNKRSSLKKQLSKSMEGVLDIQGRGELASQITDILGDTFYQVQSCKRAQLQMFLFAKTAIKDRISHPEKSVENTGFLGVFPNKGGLLCTFHIDGTKLAFISCHLTAHEGALHCAQRNASIVEILGGVRAGDHRFDVAEQFHHVFWMGDMNYRTTYSNEEPNSEINKELHHQHESFVISADKSEEPSSRIDSGEKTSHAGISDTDIQLEVPRKLSLLDNEEDDRQDSMSIKEINKREEELAKTFDMIVAKKWHEILKHDELNREITKHRVLNGFTALQPSFPPTFKRTRQLVINEDQISSDDIKQYYHSTRLPSYTDRILFKSMAAFSHRLSNRFFHSCEAVTSSDHKPVMAGFTIDVTPGAHGIMCYDEFRSSSAMKQMLRQKSGRHLERKQCCLKMSLTNLKGFDLKEMDGFMGVGGKSDPYITITSDPPHLLCEATGSSKYKAAINDVTIKNKPIIHSLNPEWPDPIIIQLASIDLEGLARNASLIISVWDWDLSNADDLIGVVTHPMRDIIDANQKGNGYDFNSNLICQSEICGRLSATISINGDLADIQGKHEDQMAHMKSLDAVVQRRRNKHKSKCFIM